MMQKATMLCKSEHVTITITIAITITITIIMIMIIIAALNDAECEGVV